MRVIFVAHTLESGGAERQLLALARGLVARGHEVLVVALRGGGRLETEFLAADVPVEAIAKSRWWMVLIVLRLPVILWRFRPEIIHGYLPLSNCIAVLARLITRRAKAVMGVRGLVAERQGAFWRVEAFYALESQCARFAAAVIANSESARESVIARGFPAVRVHVVPNGVDTDLFTFDARKRWELRQAWGVQDHEILVGRVANLRPIKDYPTFLEAAAVVVGRRPDARFVCVGDGPTPIREALIARTQELNLERFVRWAGYHDDIPAVMSALDILVSSSLSESSPNVIAEAMACGVSCVVTDTGDSATIIGNTGCLVPVRSPEAIAEGVVNMIESMEIDGKLRSVDTRHRIVEHYGLDAMVVRTVEVLQRLTVGDARVERLAPDDERWSG